MDSPRVRVLAVGCGQEQWGKSFRTLKRESSDGQSPRWIKKKRKIRRGSSEEEGIRSKMCEQCLYVKVRTSENGWTRVSLYVDDPLCR